MLTHSGQALSEAKRTLRFVRIDVPADVSCEQVDISELPAGWDSFPAPAATRRIGDAWLSAVRTCLLKVPSVSAPGDAHYLINPAHRDFNYLVPHPPGAFDSYDSYADEVFDRKELFLCHASEDRDAVVRPLRNALFDLGISSWLDEAELTTGDSITEKVNEALGLASFVVAVISPAFLRKKWPQRELRAALNREARQGVKVVLPMVVNYPGETVNFASALPLAEDKLCYTWRGDPVAAAVAIAKAVMTSKG